MGNNCRLLLVVLMSFLFTSCASESEYPSEKSSFSHKSTLDPNDPCWELKTNPTKAINDHLESLGKEQAAEHFFEVVASSWVPNGQVKNKAKTSREINYFRWGVLALNHYLTKSSVDKIKVKKFIKYFDILPQSPNIFLSQFNHGLSLDDYQSYISNLIKIDKVNSPFTIYDTRRPINFDKLMSASPCVNSRLITSAFYQIFSDNKVLVKKFSDEFLLWLSKDWFKEAFSIFVSELKLDSKDIRFIKENFEHLEKKATGAEKLTRYFVSRKLLDESGKQVGDNVKLLYNNEGFESGKKIPRCNNKIAGKKLEIDGIKTGYNIYFPALLTENSALVIMVYGGFGPENQGMDFQPGELNHLGLSLLDNNIIVVTLNLPDRLELTNSQVFMSKDIHQKIHQSIDNFFQTISRHPATLTKGMTTIDSDLVMKIEKLKNLPKFIFGGSFGGRTAIRHTQLYPNTFNGAISHDGSLSFKSENHLWPINYINDLQQKVLILHNIDDHRVDVTVSTNFVDAAINAGKNAELFLSLHGNALEPSNGDELSLKGHHVPTHEKDFDNYSRKILDFINARPKSREEIKNQTNLRIILRDKKYFKTNRSSAWYTLKELFFFHIKDKAQRNQIRTFVSDIISNTPAQ